MASSTQLTTSDGTLEYLDLSIDYLDRSEISVFFDSTETSAWAWVGATERRIQFTPVVPLGTEVLVKRTTDLSKLVHEYSQGASFDSATLDESLKQVLHIAQEASESNLSGEFFVDINMNNKRIRNIGAPVDNNDALTFGQYKADALGAFTSRQAAESAAAVATSEAANAMASATAAGNSASAAADSATAAAGSATAAGDSAANAAASAAAAAESASVATLANKLDTANPTATGKLTVNRGAGADAIEVQTDAGQDGYIDFRRGASIVASVRSAFYGLALNASQVIAFLIDGVERIRIDAAGRLGIGSSSPTNGLHLAGGVGSSIPGVRYERSAVRSYITQVTDTGEFALRDSTQGANRIVVATNGNVGFGKDNPATRINVAGGNILVDGPGFGLQLNNGQQYIVSNAEGTGITFGTAGAARYTIRSDGSFLSTGGLIGVATSAGADTSRLQVCSTDQANFGRGGYLNLHGNNRSTLPGCIQLVTGNAAGAYLSVHTADAVERLRVTDTGRLGIGTTTPTRALDVVGGIRSSVADSASIAQVETTNDGGTSVATLRTGGSAATGTLLGQPNANRTFLFSSGGNDAGLVVGTQTNTPMHFGTSNATRMTLTSTGLLGIGTTAAQRGLHLAGGDGSAVPSVRLERTGVRTYSAEVSNAGEFRILDNTQGADVLIVTGGANSAVTLQTQGSGLLNLRVGGASRLELYNNQQLFFAPTGTDNTTTLRTQEVGRNSTVRFEHGSTAITNLIGSAGAAGQLVADAGQYDVVARTDGRSFRWSVNNGTSTAMRLNSQGALELASSTLRLSSSRTPASATAAGTQGDICWDANYIYVCVATNTWRRIAHATW